MNSYALYLLVIGLLLLFVSLGSGWIKRLPFSYALIYLVVGIFLSPYGINLIQLRPNTQFLERITELVVIISLFSCSLKITRPLKPQAWNSTIRLIGFLMPISIIAIAAISHWLLNLNWGAAVALGAILSPTDPVLASEVQLDSTDDRDELRFGLTSEGGLNDALAFPFVYFGLQWLNNDSWQSGFVQWLKIDLIWAIAAGLGMGIIVGKGIIKLKQYIQQFHPIDQLMEDFIALSVILLTYALTELINGYGFLAVFIAGLMVQQSYPHTQEKLSQLEFIEQLEKLLEIATILLLGSLLRIEPILRFWDEALLVAGLLFFVIRPLGAWSSTINLKFTKASGDRIALHPATRWLLGWFGVRGVGSLYYLSYALGKGLEGEVGEQIAWITYITVVASIILHGMSATPLMKWYEQAVGKHH